MTMTDAGLPDGDGCLALSADRRAGAQRRHRRPRAVAFLATATAVMVTGATATAVGVPAARAAVIGQTGPAAAARPASPSGR
jgi:hypothetical protein